MKFFLSMIIALNTYIIINIESAGQVKDKISQIIGHKAHLDLIKSPINRREVHIDTSDKPQVLIQLIKGHDARRVHFETNTFHVLETVIGSGTESSVRIVYRKRSYRRNVFYALKTTKNVQNYDTEAAICRRIESAFTSWKNTLKHGLLIPKFFDRKQLAFVLPLMQNTLLGASAQYIEITKYPMSEYTALKCLECLMIILRNLHEKGFVNRDIKPANIMIQFFNDIHAERTKYNPKQTKCKYLVMIDFDRASEYDLTYNEHEDHGDGDYGAYVYQSPDALRGFRYLPKDDFFSVLLVILDLRGMLHHLPTHAAALEYYANARFYKYMRIAWVDSEAKVHKVSEILERIPGFAGTFLGSLLILLFKHYEELSKIRTERRLPDNNGILHSIQSRLIHMENKFGKHNRILNWEILPTKIHKYDKATLKAAKRKHKLIQYFDVKSMEYRTKFKAVRKHPVRK